MCAATLTTTKAGRANIGAGARIVQHRRRMAAGHGVLERRVPLRDHEPAGLRRNSGTPPRRRPIHRVFGRGGGNRELFKTLGKYLPPPEGVRSPALWGTRDRLTEMFGPASVSIKTQPRYFNFRYREPEHFVHVFKTFYGPMLKAFAALDAPKQAALWSDLLALIARMNKAADNGMVVPSEYLEVVITKR
jgi:hypothetical protein